MAQQTWSILTTKISNDRVKVSDSYVEDGANKLTTFTPDNLTGREKLKNSSSPILNSLFYSIDSNGFIDYYIKDPSGNFERYSSIQQIADAGILGYNSNTTMLIKNAIQGSLEAASNDKGLYEISSANARKTVNNDGSSSTSENDDENGNASVGLTRLFDTTIEGVENTPKSGQLRYPFQGDSELFKNLDKIQFVQGKYRGIQLGDTGGGLSGIDFTRRQYDFYTDSTVTLGIQPTISDSNQVKWNGGNLDQIRASAAALTSNAIAKSVADGKADFGAGAVSLFEGAKGILQDVGNNDEIAKGLNAYFAGKAVGVGGQLLSRVTGAVLNPNLELLFEGPTLRQFSYEFKMSAESEDEAEVIKKIIGWFKRGMSVRKASGQLFLTAPNVFQLKYIKGDNNSSNHDSINKIKTCALLDAKVNYTPAGNYSTYIDGTMSMYSLSLSFGEINPIYSEDYNEDNHLIGY